MEASTSLDHNIICIYLGKGLSLLLSPLIVRCNVSGLVSKDKLQRRLPWFLLGWSILSIRVTIFYAAGPWLNSVEEKTLVPLRWSCLQWYVAAWSQDCSGQAAVEGWGWEILVTSFLLLWWQQTLYWEMGRLPYTLIDTQLEASFHHAELESSRMPLTFIFFTKIVEFLEQPFLHFYRSLRQYPDT